MGLPATLVVALALSVDAFFAGAAFAVRRVKVPALSALVVGGMSGLLVLAALLAGQRLAGILPPGLTPWLGGGLLVGLGCWLLARRPAADPAVETWPDFDRSGDISLGEAVWLGIALAIDAAGTGIAMSLGGRPGPLLPIAVALATTLSLLLGAFAGARTAPAAGRSWLAAYLPGTIFIVLGLTRMLARGP
ncbi:MAG TPA: manganese efflux pump [Sphingobacteriaceae bacterium]|nr:manganese efflux pump [Sphingobacteriaceae bacterium]